MKMEKQDLKAMVVMNIIDNCTIDLDNTGQQKYTLNEKQFGDCVDTLIKNIEVIHSSLQFKKIEKPTFEEFKTEFFDYKGDEYFYKKTGEVWELLQINDRYKNMYE